MLYETPLYLVFLAASLAVYWLVLRAPAARIAFLAAVSVAFLCLVPREPGSRQRAIIEVVGAAILAVVVHRVAAQLPGKRKPWLVVAALALPLAVLILFKYPTARLPALIAGSSVIPLGLSYYTFKHLHYVIESARGRIRHTSLRDYLAYVFLFPMFTSGPIERFPSFSAQAARATWSWAQASGAVERILVGMGKKFLIADLLVAPMLPSDRLLSGGGLTLSGLQVLLAAFIRIVVVYFDFSGYTDMVLGTSRLFGISLMENFDFPFLRADLAEFWRTWHISLSSWARDYVYFPLLGWSRSANLSILATMITIGAWHGTGPGWVLWGGHHAAGLMFLPYYRRWCERRPAIQRLRSTRTWRVVATLAVWWFVAVGFALTLDPRTLGGSIQLYLKALTLGVVT